MGLVLKRATKRRTLPTPCHDSTTNTQTLRHTDTSHHPPPPSPHNHLTHTYRDSAPPLPLEHMHNFRHKNTYQSLMPQTWCWSLCKTLADAPSPGCRTHKSQQCQIHG